MPKRERAAAREPSHDPDRSAPHPGERVAGPGSCVPGDSVDALLSSWRERRPDLDFSPVAILARLSRARSHIDAELDRVFAAYGLGAASFAVLVTLARIGERRGASQRELMDELRLTSGTISVRIDRLVAEGLVDRRPDPESRRNSSITLTDRGRELCERVIPAHLANERRLLSALTESEQQTMAGLLRKLLVEFEGARPPAGTRTCLGVTVAPAHRAMAMRESVGLPPVPALLVRTVADGGPAARGGIRTGDLLVAAAGHAVRSVADLYTVLHGAGPGGRLKISLLRGTTELRVDVELDPSGPNSAATGIIPERGEHAA